LNDQTLYEHLILNPLNDTIDHTKQVLKDLSKNKQISKRLLKKN